MPRWQKCPESQSFEIFYRHQQSHEQITEENRRVAITIVPECDNNCFAHSTKDWVSNCERERSFLRLSSAKSHLRATTSQYRLDHLAVMIVESDLCSRCNNTDLRVRT